MDRKSKITDEFWDFIEAYAPNYHERDDVHRQSELQNFINGHESTVQGITREEAILLRDNILHGLFYEAIAAFTRIQPVKIPGSVSLRDYAETIANISYESGVRGFRPDYDSRTTISSIIAWADQFCRMHKDTDWNETDYLETLLDFTEEKLHNAPHLDDSVTLFTIASLNRATLKNLGYNTDNLSDRDMYEIANLAGNLHQDNAQFTNDIYKACRMFGAKEIDTK